MSDPVTSSDVAAVFMNLTFDSDLSEDSLGMPAAAPHTLCTPPCVNLTFGRGPSEGYLACIVTYYYRLLPTGSSTQMPAAAPCARTTPFNLHTV